MSLTNRLLKSTNHICYHIKLYRLYSKINSIFNIILFELLVISVTSIFKTYVFKFVLSLAILNSLSILDQSSLSPF